MDLLLLNAIANKAAGVVVRNIEGTPAQLIGADLNKLTDSDTITFKVTDDATIANITSMLARTSDKTASITFSSGKKIEDDLANFASSDGSTTTFTTAFQNASAATDDSVALKLKTAVKVGPQITRFLQ